MMVALFKCKLISCHSEALQNGVRADESGTKQSFCTVWPNTTNYANFRAGCESKWIVK